MLIQHPAHMLIELHSEDHIKTTIQYWYKFFPYQSNSIHTSTLLCVKASTPANNHRDTQYAPCPSPTMGASRARWCTLPCKRALVPCIDRRESKRNREDSTFKGRNRDFKVRGRAKTSKPRESKPSCCASVDLHKYDRTLSGCSSGVFTSTWF